jgi:predicted enzyme related to lactoylglutathione lyase
MSDGDVKVGNVLYPAADLHQAMAFYRDGLGLRVKFQDGDRFASLDGGNVTFALVSGQEDVTSGAPAVSFKVSDVATSVERLTAAGAEVVSPAADGPHETRAVLRDPAGNQFVVYAPLPR